MFQPEGAVEEIEFCLGSLRDVLLNLRKIPISSQRRKFLSALLG